jgi:hypothetical protein
MSCSRNTSRLVARTIPIVVLATVQAPACAVSQRRSEPRMESVVLPGSTTPLPGAPTQPATTRQSMPAPASSQSAAGAVGSSAEDREVLAVCERYRRAVEARNVDVLLALASPDYLEDGDNDDPGDDVDYAALEEYLRGPFQDVEDVSYDMDYQSVRWEGDTAVVEYRYRSFYRFEDIERRVVGTRQVTLRREGGALKILSGI